MISEDGVYRYELRREWDLAKPPLVCIMLNPSTADDRQNDATITRLIQRARNGGYGSIIVGNTGAGRATKPKEWLAMEDPIGPGNKRALHRMMDEARMRGGRVLVGWGNHAPSHAVEDVLRIARRIGVKLYCLGFTKSGMPLHPLHVSYSVVMRRWFT